jgi:hypothetical protein
MRTIIYSNKMGEGIILEDYTPLIIDPKNVPVASTILIANTYSSMCGYFKHDLLFCGVINKKTLVFFIGEEINGSTKKRFYQIIHLITETRLFSMFSHLAGRDFNFVNGVWK